MISHVILMLALSQILYSYEASGGISKIPIGAGGLAASQVVTWSPGEGPAVALPEITDASALCWSSDEQNWQLLSPIFGVLMLQQVHQGERAVMPVAPLLEAAITRQIAGMLPVGSYREDQVTLCVSINTGARGVSP